VAKVGGRAATAAPGVLRQEFSLTPPNSSPSENDPEEKLSFWEHLAAVPDNAWASEGEKGYKVYLYDEEQGKGSKYLELITQPFDIEWLRQNHGGGTYRAQLNDPAGRIVAKQIFSINGESKRKPPTSVQNAPAVAVPVDSFQTSVLNMIQEGQRRQEALIERLMDRDRGYGHNAPPAPPAVDPMALMTPVLQGVVSVFTSMIPKPSSPLDDLLKLKQLMGEQRDVFAELTKFKELGLIGGAGGNGDLLKQLEVVMAVAEKIGIGGGGGKSVLEVIADKGPEMLGKIVTGIGEYRALEEARMKTATAVATLQANQPRAPQTAAPTQAQLPPQPGPAAAQAPPAPVAGVLQVDPIMVAPGGAAAVAEVTEAQVNAMKAEIVQIIAQGVSGQDLFGYLRIKAPAFLNGMLRLNEAGEVIGVVTVDELALYCSMDPVLQHAAQFPQYKQVLTELLEEVKLDTMGDEQAPDGGQ
jgi:hypothetical protein